MQPRRKPPTDNREAGELIRAGARTTTLYHRFPSAHSPFSKRGSLFGFCNSRQAAETARPPASGHRTLGRLAQSTPRQMTRRPNLSVRCSRLDEPTLTPAASFIYRDFHRPLYTHKSQYKMYPWEHSAQCSHGNINRFAPNVPMGTFGVGLPTRARAYRIYLDKS